MAPVTDSKGASVVPIKSLKTGASVLFDAVYVPGGADAAETLVASGEAIRFIQEAFKHGKPIGATGEGVNLLQACNLGDIQLTDGSDRGVVTAPAGRSTRGSSFDDALVEAMKQHRFFLGRAIEAIPA